MRIATAPAMAAGDPRIEAIHAARDAAEIVLAELLHRSETVITADDMAELQPEIELARGTVNDCRQKEIDLTAAGTTIPPLDPASVAKLQSLAATIDAATVRNAVITRTVWISLLASGREAELGALRTSGIYTRFAKLKAEIQIRSILDHAWAEIAHDRAYKGSALVPTSIPEQFSRLAALLQDTDRQFEKVRDEIEGHASTTVWKIARAEGKTERVGDFTIYTSKARFPAGSQSLIWDLVLYLNTPVTNRLGPDSVTDVVAFLDGVGLSRPATMYHPSALIFSDVLQLEAIGGNEFRVRIVYLRVNAGYLVTGTPIVATLEAQSSVTGDRVKLAGPLEVGHTHPAMSFRVIDQNGDENLFLLTRDAGINNALAENPKAEGAIVNLELCFREAIDGAFRTDLQEAGVTGSPVDSGTRFVVSFLGVPNNVELYVTVRQLGAEIRSDSECKARLLEGNWAGSESAMPMATTTVATVKPTDENVQIARLQKSWNSAMAIWEWVDGDPLRLTPLEVRFGVVIVAKPGEAGAGTAQVCGYLGPISTVSTASSSSPIPRFSSFGSLLDAFSFR